MRHYLTLKTLLVVLTATLVTILCIGFPQGDLVVAPKTFAQLSCGEAIPGQFIVQTANLSTMSTNDVKAAAEKLPQFLGGTSGRTLGGNFTLVKGVEQSSLTERMKVSSLSNGITGIWPNRKTCRMDSPASSLAVATYSLSGKISPIGTTTHGYPTVIESDENTHYQFLPNGLTVGGSNRETLCSNSANSGSSCFYFHPWSYVPTDRNQDGFADISSMSFDEAIYCSTSNSCSGYGKYQLYSSLSHTDGPIDTDFASSVLDTRFAEAEGITKADIDGDGKKELVLFQQIYKQPDGFFVIGDDNSATKLNLPAQSSYGYRLSELADVNGDGRADALELDTTSTPQTLTVILNKGGNTWQRGAVYQFPYQSSLVWYQRPVIGDFNGDGYDDIILKTGDNLSYWVLISTKGGTAFQGTRLNVTKSGAPALIGSMIAADIDHDGTDDLSFLTGEENCLEQSEVTFFFENGVADGRVAENKLVGCGGGLVSIDFDSDGKKDLIYTSQNSLELLLNSSTATTPKFDDIRLADYPKPLYMPSIQLSQRINGVTAFDPFGISGVKVTATASGGKQYTTYTDESGNYEFKRLPVDTYSVTPQRVGFEMSPVATQSIQLKQITIGVNFTVNIDPAKGVAVPNFLGTNDPGAGLQWGLYNKDYHGMDINILPAWQKTKGDPSLIVAVMDEGTNFQHPDLAAAAWKNTKEIPNDGKDNDGDGYIDDYHGVDIVDGLTEPFDLGSHGTHVAGTIGARGDNKIGLVGVAPLVTMMGVRVLGSEGGTDADIVAGMNYVIALRKRGENIRVVNASYGGTSACQPYYVQPLLEMNALGITFVAAAGNEAANNDAAPFTPASCDVPNVISVGAIDSTGALANYSNYGATSVDLSAPGTEILSTFPQGNYFAISGTSMATPHVAGIVALLSSKFPSLTPAQIRAVLMQTARFLPSLAGKSVTGGLVDAGAAMALAERTAGIVAPPIVIPPPIPTTTVPFIFDPKVPQQLTLSASIKIKKLTPVQTAKGFTLTIFAEVTKALNAKTITIQILDSSGKLLKSVQLKVTKAKSGSKVSTFQGSMTVPISKKLLKNFKGQVRGIFKVSAQEAFTSKLSKFAVKGK